MSLASLLLTTVAIPELPGGSRAGDHLHISVAYFRCSIDAVPAYVARLEECRTGVLVCRPVYALGRTYFDNE